MIADGNLRRAWRAGAQPRTRSRPARVDPIYERCPYKLKLDPKRLPQHGTLLRDLTWPGTVVYYIH